MALMSSSMTWGNKMGRSERITILLFLFVCMAVFFALYYILGGEDTAFTIENPPVEDYVIEDDYLEDEKLPNYGRTRITRSPSTVRFEGGGGSGYSSTSVTSQDSDRKRKSKQRPDWVEKYRRKSKGLSLDQKKAKLRKRLLDKGFKNTRYIEMRVLELDTEGLDAATDEAEMLVEAGSVEAALERLEREYGNTPDENLIIRSEILSLQMMIAMKFGYATLAETYLHKHTRISREIRDIKKNTILASNPNAIAMMELQGNTLDAYDQHKDKIPSLFQWMKDNKGLSPEVLKTMRSTMVNQVYSRGEVSSTQMQSNYKHFETFVKDGWANPK